MEDKPQLRRRWRSKKAEKPTKSPEVKLDFEKFPLIRNKHETIGKNPNDIEAVWKFVEYVLQNTPNSVELIIVHYRVYV